MTLDAINQMHSQRAFMVSERAISREEEQMNFKMPYDASNHQFSPSHSRSSSIASATSSPVTSSFSSRSHSRWSSSASSHITTPDSPVNMVKQALDDLVEEPAEKDEPICQNQQVAMEEQICICDTIFCHHQQPRMSRSAEVVSLSTARRTCDTAAGDDVFSDALSSDRRGSGGSSEGSLTTRVSPRWPSISKHWRNRRATTSVSGASVRSAPPSRSSSTKKSSVNRCPPASFESYHFAPTSVAAVLRPEGTSGSLSVSSWPNSPGDTNFGDIHESEGDPIERQELSPTPLLPPLLAELRVQEEEDDEQSPLQSPSVAARSPTESIFSSPVNTPATQSIYSPSLSAKPSSASIRVGYLNHAAHTSVNISPFDTSKETDKWAIELGHANFRIFPEPYVPTTYDSQSCNRLLEDWKTAQIEYLRQAARIGEHYGPTSRTYDLARQKWDEIEMQWRCGFREAQQKTEANGEILNLEPLEEIQSFAIPDKFPDIDDADIVGPMVQYAKIEPPPERKSALLRLFTDPASILRKR